MNDKTPAVATSPIQVDLEAQRYSHVHLNMQQCVQEVNSGIKVGLLKNHDTFLYIVIC